MIHSIYRNEIQKTGRQIEYSRVSLEEVMSIRQRVLRPNGSISDTIVPADRSEYAAHFAAHLDAEVIGAVSIAPDPCPGKKDDNAYRLRGIAVLPQFHGQGIASALITQALAHVKPSRVQTVWAYARPQCATLLDKFGFVRCGNFFEMEETGPHILVVASLSG